MTTTYKVLGQLNSGDTNVNSLYTVPAGNSAVLSTLTICNLTGAQVTYRVAISPAGAATANSHYIVYANPIQSNDSVFLTLGMTVAATDVVKVQSSTASALNFSLFGSEIY